MRTTLSRLKAVIAPYKRIAITGWPKTGKTTLSEKLCEGRKVFHSDDNSGLGWSEASAKLANDVNKHEGSLVVEGVSVPRAIRKGMNVDAVIMMSQPFEVLKSGQMSMGRGVKTVLDELRKENPRLVVIEWQEDLS